MKRVVDRVHEGPSSRSVVLLVCRDDICPGIGGVQHAPSLLWGKANFVSNGDIAASKAGPVAGPCPFQSRVLSGRGPSGLTLVGKWNVHKLLDEIGPGSRRSWDIVISLQIGRPIRSTAHAQALIERLAGSLDIGIHVADPLVAIVDEDARVATDVDVVLVDATRVGQDVVDLCIRYVASGRCAYAFFRI
jgi:hypothetical protein